MKKHVHVVSGIPLFLLGVYYHEQYLDMNFYVWDLKLPLIVMQVFKKRKKLFCDSDKGDFIKILVEIKNINHNLMIFVIYTNEYAK
jgi:hypothetical protein